jgi:hypothetical protein
MGRYNKSTDCNRLAPGFWADRDGTLIAGRLGRRVFAANHAARGRLGLHTNLPKITLDVKFPTVRSQGGAV